LLSATGAVDSATVGVSDLARERERFAGVSVVSTIGSSVVFFFTISGALQAAFGLCHTTARGLQFSVPFTFVNDQNSGRLAIYF
jgi:hypothetical protein